MKARELPNRKWAFSVFRQVISLILISLILGVLVNWIRSDSLPLLGDWSPETRLTLDSGASMMISLEDAKELCTSNTVIFLDARSPEHYKKGHIRCALNIPWQSLDEYLDRVLDEIPDDAWIVTYCDGEDCSLSEDLAKELLSMGYEKVRVLLNGWTRWVQAGLPTEDGQG